MRLRRSGFVEVIPKPLSFITLLLMFRRRILSSPRTWGVRLLVEF